MANQATIMLRLAANIDSLEKQLDKAKAKVANTANGMVAPMVAANKKVTDSLAASATSISKFGQLTNNQRFIIRDFSYQISDMAVQLGNGTSFLRTFGQQVPQMLGPMGMFGALLGTVVAVAAPLAQALMGPAEQTKYLQQNISDLSSAVTAYISLAAEAALPTETLAKKYGDATSAAKTFLAALRDIDQLKVASTASAIADQMTSTFGVSGSFSELSQQIAALEAVRQKREQLNALRSSMSPETARYFDFSKELNDLQSAEAAVQQFNTAITSTAHSFQLTNQQVEALVLLSAKVREASPADRVAAMQELSAAVKNAYGSLEKMPKPIKDLYDQLNNAGNALAQMQGTADGSATKLGAAADAAKRLADELGRAMANAEGMVASSSLQRKLAELRLKYLNDPVEYAKQSTAAQFDAQHPNIPLGSPLAVDRQVQIDNAVETAKIQQEINRRLAAQKTDTKSGAKYTKNLDSLFASADNQLANQQLQIELIGKTGAEAAKLRAEYALLAEARKRNLDLDKIDADTGRTLRQEITARATAIGELTQKAQDYTAAQQFMTQEQNALKQGFLDAIVSGKSFGSVLGQVAQQLEKAALQAAIFGDGPLAGLFGHSSSSSGGGLVGGLLKAIGFRAAGGPVTAGQPYIVGEKQAELFVPDQNGTILPAVPSISAAGSSVQRVKVEGGNLTLTDDGTIAAKIRISSMSAAGAAVKTSRQQFGLNAQQFQSRGTN